MIGIDAALLAQSQLYHPSSKAALTAIKFQLA